MTTRHVTWASSSSDRPALQIEDAPTVSDRIYAQFVALLKEHGEDLAYATFGLSMYLWVRLVLACPWPRYCPDDLSERILKTSLASISAGFGARKISRGLQREMAIIISGCVAHYIYNRI
ncbi:MAG: hypothetical protein JSR58_04485 [Verrucomicrobia bacterium]|nr:hypothetical protein [Verrucomicrobiota bacterium]